MRLAWHIAALGRVGKLPSLDSVQIRPPQTVAEQRAVLASISARFGIRMRRVRLIRKEAA